MDYALPRADDLPVLDLGFNGTRCTTNPLGVKGCGEAGAVGAFPAVINAISDALAPFCAADFAGPAIPERIWQAIRGDHRPAATPLAETAWAAVPAKAGTHTPAARATQR